MRRVLAAALLAAPLAGAEPYDCPKGCDELLKLCVEGCAQRAKTKAAYCKPKCEDVARVCRDDCKKAQK